MRHRSRLSTELSNKDMFYKHLNGGRISLVKRLANQVELILSDHISVTSELLGGPSEYEKLAANDPWMLYGVND